ncbi:MAG: T9SS type A sorting domain-containing protein [Paludibacteraceae bacterium]|nr:T9SS type A sorting domain-containing protein [Paludibacteraceae bacterium]
MKKKIFTVLGLLFCIMSANAALQYMTIELKNGKKFSFLLKENPVITYQNDRLVINGDESTSYSIDGVKNYYFTEDNQSAVKNASADFQALRIVSLDENTIKVENASVGVVAILFNINGSIVATSATNNEGEVEISLPNQKGVYLLNIGAQSLKLIRK